MRKYGMLVCAAVVVSGALTTWLLLRPQYISGQSPPPPISDPIPKQNPPHKRGPGHEPVLPLIFGPIPCQGMPPDIVTLSPVEKLGKLIIYDCELSDPPATLGGRREGYSCATCHMPQVGFTSAYKGDASLINLLWGPLPGVVRGRAGNRRPQTYAYTAFRPSGPYFDNKYTQSYVGGAFWDGRVPDLTAQAMQPFINPNEMDNTPTNGVYPPVFGGYSALVAQKVTTKYRRLFEAAFGPGIIQRTTPAEQFVLTCMAVAAFEGSAEVCQFSSKYDASKFGVPPQHKYTLTASEERGRVLFFGKAHCHDCHSSAKFPTVSDVTNGKDTFSTYLFGVSSIPRNPDNPFYRETDSKSNPHGYNPLGDKWVDYGLGANPNPAPDGTKFYNKTPGDIPQFRGMFQVPTVRNVDLRPHPGFVKAHFHNGIYKSLKEVVHFYNKRNVAVKNGKEVGYSLLTGPPPGYTPLIPPPEVTPNETQKQSLSSGKLGTIGNLGLTERQEDDIVAFLRILSDGFTKPNPVENVTARKATVENARKLIKQLTKAKPSSKTLARPKTGSK
jgi:cytochrome c peroxidase